MKQKITQIIPILITLLVILFALFGQWCTIIDHFCYRTFLDQMIPEVTYPLYFFSLYLLPLVFILIFTPRNLYLSWLKFALWTIPLAFIFIAITPVNHTGIGPDFYPFYRDDAAELVGKVFTGLSLTLIAWKYFRLRRKSTEVT